MYKIYINDTPIFLVNTENLSDEMVKYDQKLVARYTGKPKFLLQYIDMLEKTDRYEAVFIHYSTVKKLWKDFKSLYKRIKAAGGAVFNDKGELLMIYRMKTWDLPKGKIDPGETKKEAAIREVQEETGLVSVHIVKRLMKTLHTYRRKDGTRILKYSYWYLMTTKDKVLTPQTEEDIEEAIWIKKDEFLASNKKAYPSILDLINSID